MLWSVRGWFRSCFGWCHLIACREWDVVIWYVMSKWHFRLDLDLTLRTCLDPTLQATLSVYSLPSDRWDRGVWVTCWFWIVRVVIVGLWVLAQGLVVLIHDDYMQHVDVYMLWMMMIGPHRTCLTEDISLLLLLASYLCVIFHARVVMTLECNLWFMHRVG